MLQYITNLFHHICKHKPFFDFGWYEYHNLVFELFEVFLYQNF